MRSMTKANLVKRIKKQRERQKLSTVKAAQAAGIAQSTWWSIEAGKQDASWDKVFQMASGVGLKIAVSCSAD
jgi:DNA-binding XRE family transcriptional regulator